MLHNNGLQTFLVHASPYLVHVSLGAGGQEQGWELGTKAGGRARAEMGGALSPTLMGTGPGLAAPPHPQTFLYAPLGVCAPQFRYHCCIDILLEQPMLQIK